jgi:DNA-binding response OmpR family regulator
MQRQHITRSPGMPAVLIVEPNEFLLEMAAQWLRATGYSVLGVTSERDAAQLLETERIDVAVLELDLRRSEGVSLLERTCARLNGTPLILLSGSVNYEDVVRQLARTRRVCLLPRPYSLLALGEAVRNALGGESATVIPIHRGAERRRPGTRDNTAQ